MAIGLNEIDLFLVFQKSFLSAKEKFSVETFTEDTGGNPQIKDFFDWLQKQMPNLTFEEFTNLFRLFLALFITIVANNNELAKVIPHVEQ